MEISILEGGNVEYMKEIEGNSIDFIFADPPYNIQNKHGKAVKYSTNLALRDKNWSPHYAAYDTIDDYWEYSRLWLTEAHRILSSTGSIFVTGTYHNIHTIAVIMKELGFWAVADVAWCKPNAMPNLAMYGPVQSVETVLWRRKGEKPAHYYDSSAAKILGGGVNVKTHWIIPKPSNRQFKYPGRKPVELVYQALMLTSKKDGPIRILDPFAGSGTTGIAAKRIVKEFNCDGICILIDEDPNAIAMIRERIKGDI